MLEMERDLEYLSMGFKRETSFRYLRGPNSGSAIIILSLSLVVIMIDDRDKQERLIRLDFYDDVCWLSIIIRINMYIVYINKELEKNNMCPKSYMYFMV